MNNRQFICTILSINKTRTEGAFVPALSGERRLLLISACVIVTHWGSAFCRLAVMIKKERKYVYIADQRLF